MFWHTFYKHCKPHIDVALSNACPICSTLQMMLGFDTVASVGWLLWQSLVIHLSIWSGTPSSTPVFMTLPANWSSSCRDSPATRSLMEVDGNIIEYRPLPSSEPCIYAYPRFHRIYQHFRALQCLATLKPQWWFKTTMSPSTIWVLGWFGSHSFTVKRRCQRSIASNKPLSIHKWL